VSTTAPVVVAEEGGFGLMSLIRLIWRYKILVAGLSLLFGVIAAVVGLVSKEIFRAEVIVTEADHEGLGGPGSLMGQIGGLASLAGVEIGEGSRNREAKALLRSRRLAEEFIRRYDLLPVLIPHPTPDKPATVWHGVRRFKARMLNVREDTRTQMITITISAGNAKDAARYANGYIALANELMRTRAIDEATRNVKYLEAQIEKTSVVEIQRLMYKLVENETKTLMLANARPEYAFTTVDPAVPPEERSSPQRTLMVLFGLVLGFVIGVGAAFSHDVYRRNRQAAVGA
jgi:uncharacterized protein involved in exopolysaccharide biosynthesis